MPYATNKDLPKKQTDQYSSNKKSAFHSRTQGRMKHLGAYIAAPVLFAIAGGLVWTHRACGALGTPHLIAVGGMVAFGALLLGGADATQAASALAPYVPWRKSVS